MLTAARKAGRLVTIRISSPISEEELPRFEMALQRALLAAAGPVVFCSDLRGAQVMREDIAGKLIRIMRHHNPALVRTALVMPPDGVVIGLQIERMVREAGNPNRRTFRSPVAASAWLAEVLTEEEQAGLAQFLAEEA